ncbi:MULTISPECIES: helix-turn-helix domain-containing protein [Streptomyces]|uniref:Helix-turn-helix transcriptional regulator n=3 Tax=Streptomyces rimosus TaxID=1927 RepID=L8ELR5_STRR1|nr:MULTISPECIES: helix-turn-helix transcriptional regulator [Streptomyces]KOG77470.1 XRE family transcriptional regulator [Kitasatospora aureofaciens]MYT44687.1 helix-turn-helix domain-containing protein [Streptomyces sp. SID5471]KOT43058.1 XRE family transcriptional regulator [Streptomyces sp. NRRL WC-3701]KOT62354.1 XRE family transcriptional regulator [Streptomyces rimosus subsp. rimosus]KOT62616.1 XRE family transcriptional regulator [Streptomyces rimosus subsp. rimosus]
MAKGSIDVERLYAALDAQRTARDLSWRQLAKTLEVSPSLLSRLANGLRPDVDAFATLVQWLGVPAEQFMVSAEEPSEREEPELVAQLGPLLRARKDLEPEDVAYLEAVIQATVRRVKALPRD